MTQQGKMRGGIVGVLLAAVLALMASPAIAADDYPAPLRAPTPMDSMVDDWGYYNRECTSFVAWALTSRNGFSMPHAIGNASAWGGWAQSHGYAVNMTPAVGSVAWWSSGFGHVAWVRSVNGDGTVTIEEYNADYAGNYSERTVAANSVNGYIHFKDLPPISTGSNRIAMVDYNNELYAMDGVGGSWVFQHGNVKSVSIAADTGRMLYVTNDDKAWSKDSLTAPAVLQFNGARAVAISPDGNRMMVANAAGNVYAKDGSGAWAQVAGPMVRAIDIGQNGRMMYLDGNYNAWSKDQLGSPPVIQMYDVRSIAIGTDGRMMTANADGTVYAKDGGNWMQVAGPMVKKIALGKDDRILYIDGLDDGYTMAGLTSPPVVQLLDIKTIALGESGIMLATNADGTLYGKDGNGNWVTLVAFLVKAIGVAGG